MQSSGVSKANFCKEALRGVNRKSLDKLLYKTETQQDCFVCATVYGRAWLFFEKKRVYEGLPKSAERLEAEACRPRGYLARDIVAPPPPPLPVVKGRRRGRQA